MGQTADIKPIELGNKQGEIWGNDRIQQAVSYILEHYEIRKPIQDTSKMVIVCKDKERYEFPPTPDDLFIDLQRNDINVSETLLNKIVRSNNYIPPFNPITEYFDSIRGKWKGESQIDLFCKHLIPRSFSEHPEEYYKTRMDKLIRKWLVACVAMWLRSEPNDVALGFINKEEGMGKTHLVKFLTPSALSEFYIQSSEDDKKFDIEDVFTRYMFVNFDELNGINRRSIDTWKACMSDDEVLTKHRNEQFPTLKRRIAAALFTSNRTEELGGFLHQSFGYRRFGTIELDSIDFNYSKVVDVDQLWSEALTLMEETKFNYIFNQEDFDELKQYNRRYHEVTPAMKFVERHLIRPTTEQMEQHDESIQTLNATAIFRELQSRIKAEELKHITANTIGTALTSLGFERKSFRPEGGASPIYGYLVIINDKV